MPTKTGFAEGTDSGVSANQPLIESSQMADQSKATHTQHTLAQVAGVHDWNANTPSKIRLIQLIQLAQVL